jgi:hypothetical protein
MRLAVLALSIALPAFSVTGFARELTADPVDVTVKINESIMPVARGKKYGDPLDRFLQTAGAGEVTGAGTALGPSGKPSWVEITLDLRDPELNIPLLVSKLKELGAPTGSYVEYEWHGEEHSVHVE